ncbi:hypothetical protein MYCO108962_14060 [Mycobacterium colombiense]|uniref:Uncharacterized protein n=1 Tax=Mycobacterium [tuberculosis] TKK-01-0051 TaxID=1324261 RepID=A0A051U0D8_9MYCO|nr:hypothetical protein K875_02977 [Mycobacterium [tuberculosis] TKK-01-0051]
MMRCLTSAKNPKSDLYPTQSAAAALLTARH